jgi:CMP-N-acetylneuraminic acid synthetase
VIAFTIHHAQQSKLVDSVVLTTDSTAAASIGKTAGCHIVNRPPELAIDQARVDQVVRHAVLEYEDHLGQQVRFVVILYGNVPVRAEGIVDHCVDHLINSGADSVRTVAPVTKTHPDWLHRLEGDRMVQYRPNSIHRRQDLEPLFYHDGAVVAVTRASLMTGADSDDPHAFFGSDRRAVEQREEDTVDIDTQVDFYRAEAILRMQSETNVCEPPSAGSRRPRITAAVPYMDR